MVSLLLENRSPLNATDVAGYTALHHGKTCSAVSLPSESIGLVALQQVPCLQ